MIALGETLELSMYEPLHQIPAPNASICEIDTSMDTSESEQNVIPLADAVSTDNVENENVNERMEAAELLTLVYESLRAEIETGINEVARGVNVFVKRYGRMNQNQLISSLHSFGGAFVNHSKSKIRVQPTALSRRKSKTGSRSKPSILPHRSISVKRKHDISEAIRTNVPSAKKAGRVMKSVTTYPVRKNKIEQVLKSTKNKML